jgi:hypothetical protein
MKDNSYTVRKKGKYGRVYMGSDAMSFIRNSFLNFFMSIFVHFFNKEEISFPDT